MRRLLPPALRRGDTIGIIATSSPTAVTCPRRLARAIRQLEDLGYGVRVAPGVVRKPDQRWVAGPATQRARDLHDLVGDDEVTAMMATVGGLVTNTMLEELDWDLIGGCPKLLIGYSDLTVLQAALWARTGIGAIYGPALLPQFGEPGGVDRFTLGALREVAESASPAGAVPHPTTGPVGRQAWDVDDDEPRPRAPVPPSRAVREGRAEGPLVPANLDALLTLAGTPWFPPLVGAVLALDVTNGVEPARLHANLVQLRQLGAFRAAAGLVLGRLAPGPIDDTTLDQVVLEVVDGQLPVVAGLAFGHADPIVALPWGARASLVADAEGASLTLLEAAVAPR
jgi:muramoyltetrapeptide carboxypeptidase